MRTDGGEAPRRLSLCGWLLALGGCLTPASLTAQPVAVRHREGTEHGFLVLRSEGGRTLATGDSIQTVSGTRVSGKLTLHFFDGSLHEETSVFEQRSAFRLLTDHLRQQGPAFPHRVDRLIDAVAGKVTEVDADGKSRSYRIRIPDDVANGIMVTFLKNLPSLDSETTVSLIVSSSGPRVVRFHIKPDGTQSFSSSGAERECLHLVGHTEIPGATGVVAHMLGKQPPDVDFWMVEGKAPAFLKFRGPLYEGGPMWNVELASPTVELRTSERRTPS